MRAKWRWGSWRWVGGKIELSIGLLPEKKGESVWRCWQSIVFVLIFLSSCTAALALAPELAPCTLLAEWVFDCLHSCSSSCSCSCSCTFHPVLSKLNVCLFLFDSTTMWSSFHYPMVLFWWDIVIILALTLSLAPCTCFAQSSILCSCSWSSITIRWIARRPSSVGPTSQDGAWSQMDDCSLPPTRLRYTSGMVHIMDCGWRVIVDVYMSMDACQGPDQGWPVGWRMGATWTCRSLRRRGRLRSLRAVVLGGAIDVGRGQRRRPQKQRAAAYSTAITIVHCLRFRWHS